MRCTRRLAMPLAERLRRYCALRERVWDTTASKYCARFLAYLEHEATAGAKAQAAGRLVAISSPPCTAGDCRAAIFQTRNPLPSRPGRARP